MPEIFHTPIKLEKISNLSFRLLEDTLIFGTLIPKNIVTDGVSIPRTLWWLCDPYTDGFRAALVHDYHYQVYDISRYDADKKFLKNLKLSGFSVWRRYLLYAGVRLFGWIYWKPSLL
jgi:hypothetical protein